MMTSIKSCTPSFFCLLFLPPERNELDRAPVHTHKNVIKNIYITDDMCHLLKVTLKAPQQRFYLHVFVITISPHPVLFKTESN